MPVRSRSISTRLTPPAPQLFLFLDVQVPPGTRGLVRRAEHLDHRHHPPARLDVDDLDEPLPDRLGLFQVELPAAPPPQRRCPSRHLVLAAGRARRPARPGRCSGRGPPMARRRSALVNSGQQATWQVLLERIARIRDQAVMNIARELLKVWVHPRKRTARWSKSPAAQRSLPMTLPGTLERGHSSRILQIMVRPRVQSGNTVFAAVPAQHFLHGVRP